MPNLVIPRSAQYWRDAHPVNVGLEFDGLTEKVVYSTTGKLPLSGFVWARGRGTADLDSQYIVSDLSSDNTGNSFNWWTWSNNGLFYIQYYEPDTITSSASSTWDSTALSTTELRAFGWSHSGSTSEKEFDLYLNGETYVAGTGFADVGTGFELSPTADMSYGGRSYDANRGWDGDIHLLTLWDVELTTVEHARLGAGAHPLTIRPERVIFHPDNIRNINVITGDTGTVTGTPKFKASDYSNVSPADKTLIMSEIAAAPPAGSAPVYLFHNRHHNRSA